MDFLLLLNVANSSLWTICLCAKKHSTEAASAAHVLPL